ncbi:MAG: ribosome maturation factor RimP [Candidatus Abyssubacteria bacterium]
MKNMNSIEERVAAAIESLIEAEGYYLVDLEYKQSRGSAILRLFIDKPEGGVSIDDCQRVSELLSPVLDVENIIERRYYLEVSSPGINRRIRKKADFERFAGTKVRIHLRSPLGGRRKITGVIDGVEDDEVVISEERSDGAQRHRVPLAAIDHANLQVF